MKQGTKWAPVPAAAALMALLVLTAHPASAGPLDPQFRNERTYFHCGAPTKLGNANLMVDGSVPGWNTTPPAGSVQAGNGCGTADFNAVLIVVADANPTDGVWEGAFTGNLKDLTVQVDCICLGTSRADNSASIGVRLQIDGEPITGDGTARHNLTVTQQNSGATQRYEFSVTNIGITEPNIDIDGDGIGDNPFGVEVHEIQLILEGYSPQTNAWGMWVYDTTEVPSGITFNPTTLAALRIPRS